MATAKPPTPRPPVRARLSRTARTPNVPRGQHRVSIRPRPLASTVECSTFAIRPLPSVRCSLRTWTFAPCLHARARSALIARNNVAASAGTLLVPITSTTLTRLANISRRRTSVGSMSITLQKCAFQLN